MCRTRFLIALGVICCFMILSAPRIASLYPLPQVEVEGSTDNDDDDDGDDDEDEERNGDGPPLFPFPFPADGSDDSDRCELSKKEEIIGHFIPDALMTEKVVDGVGEDGTAATSVDSDEEEKEEEHDAILFTSFMRVSSSLLAVSSPSNAV